MTEAIVKRESTTIALADIERMSDYIVKSGLFAIKTREQAIVLMLICQAKGLHPMEAVERYHIIQGRQSMRADAMLADYQKRGGKITWITSTDLVAEAEFMSAGIGKPFRCKYTIEMAKRAGLAGKDNWKKDPEAMLRWRCATTGIRATDPGVNQGVYTPEEVAEFIDVTPNAPASTTIDAAPQKIEATRPTLTLEALTKAPEPAPVETMTAKVMAAPEPEVVTEVTEVLPPEEQAPPEPPPAAPPANGYRTRASVEKLDAALRNLGDAFCDNPDIEMAEYKVLRASLDDAFRSLGEDYDTVTEASYQAARQVWVTLNKRAKEAKP